MPVHGEYRMQKSHAGLAVDTGVEKDLSLSLSNGDVLAHLPGNSAHIAGHFNAQDIYVDGILVVKSEQRSGIVAIYPKMVSSLLSQPLILNLRWFYLDLIFLFRGFCLMRSESGDLTRKVNMSFQRYSYRIENKDAQLVSLSMVPLSRYSTIPIRKH